MAETSLVLCTPVYEDWMPEHTLSMLSLFRECRKQGVRVAEPELLYRQGSLIVQARNQLAEEFLDKTDAEWSVWADRDVQYDGETVLRMIRYGEPVVGVAVPSRKESAFEFFGELEPIDHRGLCEVAGVSFSLTVVHRSVFEMFRSDLMGSPFREKPGRRPEEHTGEDAMFCSDWRKVGGKVHLMPDATIGHVGRIVFRGNLLEEMRKR